MAVNLSPYGGVGAQFLDNSGNVLTGGKIETYAAGTTTNQVTYTTSAGNIPHSNPIILDASGRVPSGGEIWLTDGFAYKFILRDANNVLIATYDNVTGINSNFVAFTNEQEIQTATAGQTVFNLTTITYQPATNSLTVFVDGVNQYGPGAQYAYLETDGDTVTFVNGLHVGAEVKFTTSQLNSSASQSDAFQVSYTPPFTGSVATSVGDKLAQTVSVADFGAVGDGVADDTVAIQNAIVASYGKKLIFPTGTYLLTSQFGGLLAGEIVITDDLVWEGETPETTLFFNPSANTEGMFGFDLVSYNVQIKNLTFDLNNKGSVALELQNQSATMAYANLSNVLLDNITVKNARMYTTTIGAFAVYCRGGFNNVKVINSTFIDLTLDSGLTPGHVGGTHVFVGEDAVSSTNRYCENTIIENCYFSNVTCDDAAVTQDMDGIRVFAPLPSAFGNTELVPSTLVVQNSTFENCWTRSIKSKVQLNSVENCTFKRTTSPTTGSNIHVDFQHNGGVVQGCKVYNNGVITSGCFAATMNTSIEDSVMGLMCTNNQIYHTGANGIIYPFATQGNAPGVMGAVIKNNTVIADVDALLNFSWLGTNANFVCSDNTVQSLSIAIVRVTGNGGLANGNVFSNVHLDTANPVPVAVDGISGSAAFALINGSGNIGITNILGNYTGAGNRQQMLFGGMLGACNFETIQNTSGGAALETLNLADDATIAFSRRGAQQIALYMLVAQNWNNNGVVMFVGSTSGTISIYAGSSIELGTTSNPDVDAKLNIWVDAATGQVNIKNRLGSNRTFTLYHLG